ncbi:unnamed protein product, partial [Laminaria digitata]
MDETLVPAATVDASEMITDDEIFDELVTSFLEGVGLTVVIDACHGGYVLDLPYCVKADAGTVTAMQSGEQL